MAIDHQKIIGQLEAHPKGLSLMPDGSLPSLKEGYIVSVSSHIVKKIMPPSIDRVIQEILHHPLASLIGGWFSEKSGLYYLDASAHILSLEKALSLAKSHRQEAIYDVIKKECLYLN